MDNPCKYCSDNPHHCMGLCKDAMKYINETGKKAPMLKHKEVQVYQKEGVIFDYNKNGIRRELVR